MFFEKILGNLKSEDHVSGYFSVLRILNSYIKKAVVLDDHFCRKVVEKIGEFKGELNETGLFSLLALVNRNEK